MGPPEELRVKQIVGNKLPSYLYLASIIFNLGSEDLQDLSRRLPQQLNHRRQNFMDFHHIHLYNTSKHTPETDLEFKHIEQTAN